MYYFNEANKFLIFINQIKLKNKSELISLLIFAKYLYS